MNGGMERNAVNVMTKDLEKYFFIRKSYIKKKIEVKKIFFKYIKKQRDGTDEKPYR
jgi:hypothetical protein